MLGYSRATVIIYHLRLRFKDGGTVSTTQEYLQFSADLSLGQAGDS